MYIMKLMERIYETMVIGVEDGYGVPGVEDAFLPGSYCMERYEEMRAAYDRVCDRLGVAGEDKDIETMLHALNDIQKELCYRMYCYGKGFSSRC